jgi:hypothetical protein
MIRQAKVLMTFIKRDLPFKLVLGDRVYTKMQSAGIYPSPEISYADMLLIQKDLAKKVVGPQGGSVEQYREQDEAEKKWDAMMRKQARYVNFVAKGDRVKLEASGFPLTADEAKRWQIPHIERLPHVSGNNKSGGIDIEIPATLYATAYNYLLVTDPKTVSYVGGRMKIAPGNEEVIHICSTRKKINVKHLTEGRTYFVLVYAVGPAGMGNFAPPVSIMFPG